MDAEIVYCADEKYRTRLNMLRKKAGDILAAPFSREDYKKAEGFLKEAEHHYASAMLAQRRSDVLAGAACLRARRFWALCAKKGKKDERFCKTSFQCSKDGLNAPLKSDKIEMLENQSIITVRTPRLWKENTYGEKA